MESVPHGTGHNWQQQLNSREEILRAEWISGNIPGKIGTHLHVDFDSRCMLSRVYQSRRMRLAGFRFFHSHKDRQYRVAAEVVVRDIHLTVGRQSLFLMNSKLVAAQSKPLAVTFVTALADDVGRSH